MLLEDSCPAHHLPPAVGAVLQLGPAAPAHNVAAVALVQLVPRPELVVAHLQELVSITILLGTPVPVHCCLVWFWYWCSSSRPAMSSKPFDLKKPNNHFERKLPLNLHGQLDQGPFLPVSCFQIYSPVPHKQLNNCSLVSPHSMDNCCASPLCFLVDIQCRAI